VHVPKPECEQRPKVTIPSMSTRAYRRQSSTGRQKDRHALAHRYICPSCSLARRCLTNSAAACGRWGRNIESFSEDPAVIAALGASYIHGIQRGRNDAADRRSAASGYLKIMAVPKHIGAYSVECFNPTGGPNQMPNCPVYRSNFNAVPSP
jgi:hypothetical protein